MMRSSSSSNSSRSTLLVLSFLLFSLVSLSASESYDQKVVRVKRYLKEAEDRKIPGADACDFGGDHCCEGLEDSGIRKCGLYEGDCDGNGECDDGNQFNKTLLSFILKKVL